LPFLPTFDQWPDRKDICLLRGSGGPAGPSSSSASSSSFPKTGSGGLMDFKGRPGDRPDRSSKLSALASAGLGHLVDKRSVEGLAEMQARLQTRQVELAQLVMTGKISREKYIKELDEAMRQAAKTGESLLGVDDFHKVFCDTHGLRRDDVGRVVHGRATASVAAPPAPPLRLRSPRASAGSPPPARGD